MTCLPAPRLSRGSRARVAASIALVLAPAGVHAQQPLSLGSAAGFGIGAVTEARLGEAVLWNPALLAIYDGPLRAYSVGNLALGGGPWRPAKSLLDVRRDANAVEARSFAPGAASQLLGWVGDRDTRRASATAGIEWLSLQAPTLGITLTSSAHAAGWIPQRAAAQIAGAPSAIMFAPTAADSTSAAHHSSAYAVTTLGIGKATDLGTLPVLGRVWAGMTAKASLVHVASEGRFSFGDAVGMTTGSAGESMLPRAGIASGQSATRYTELSVVNPLLYGLDAGVVIQPLPSVVLGASLANALQYGTFRHSATPARLTTVVIAGRDSATGTGAHIATREQIDTASALPAWWAGADALAQRAHFAPVGRASASFEGDGARVVLGVALPFESRPSLDGDDIGAWSVSVVNTSSASHPRVGYTRRRDGSSVTEMAYEEGSCGLRHGMSFGVERRPDQSAVWHVGISWTRGTPPCGSFR